MLAGFFRKLIIFGVDNSSSVHSDNRKKNILFLRKCPTDRLDNTTLTAGAEYSLNRTSLYYKGFNSFFIFNCLKIYQFKGKGSEFNAYSLCLGSISQILLVVSS